jgi:hypothetical protein
MQRRLPSVLRACAALLVLVVAAACGGDADTTAPAGSMSVTLSRPRVALGSPVEIAYSFTLAADAAPLGARKVFVHFLDANDELMWTDDHDPPTPTSAWKPGETVQYTRTMFVGRYPYVGAAKVVAGLYAPDTNERVKLANEDRGDRSYKVVDFELLPQTENIFLIYKDGWHSAEVVADREQRVEWQWTKKEATVAFRNPKRDVTLYLQADNPMTSPQAARQIEVRIGDQLIGVAAVSSDESIVQTLPVSAAQMGEGDMVELRLVADKTLVPALEAGSGNADARELGVRVFHAFVQ